MYEYMYVIPVEKYKALVEAGVTREGGEHGPPPQQLIDSVAGDVSGGQVNHIEIGEGGRVVIKPNGVSATSQKLKRAQVGRDKRGKEELEDGEVVFIDEPASILEPVVGERSPPSISTHTQTPQRPTQDVHAQTDGSQTISSSIATQTDLPAKVSFHSRETQTDGDRAQPKLISREMQTDNVPRLKMVSSEVQTDRGFGRQSVSRDTSTQMDSFPAREIATQTLGEESQTVAPTSVSRDTQVEGALEGEEAVQADVFLPNSQNNVVRRSRSKSRVKPYSVVSKRDTPTRSNLSDEKSLMKDIMQHRLQIIRQDEALPVTKQAKKVKITSVDDSSTDEIVPAKPPKRGRKKLLHFRSPVQYEGKTARSDDKMKALIKRRELTLSLKQETPSSSRKRKRGKTESGVVPSPKRPKTTSSRKRKRGKTESGVAPSPKRAKTKPTRRNRKRKRDPKEALVLSKPKRSRLKPPEQNDFLIMT